MQEEESHRKINFICRLHVSLQCRETAHCVNTSYQQSCSSRHKNETLADTQILLYEFMDSEEFLCLIIFLIPCLPACVLTYTTNARTTIKILEFFSCPLSKLIRMRNLDFFFFSEWNLRSDPKIYQRAKKISNFRNVSCQVLELSAFDIHFR